MTSIEPPAPAGTKYDGDSRFEAMVYGWAASTELWNGDKPGTAAHDRSQLAGFFEQYLEQQNEPDLSVFSPTARRVLEALRSVDRSLVEAVTIDRTAALVLRDFAVQQLAGGVR